MNELLSTRLLLVRHGQTADNVGGQLAGWRDSELTDEGVRQARRLADYLAHNFQVDAIYTSSLQRGVLTATILGEKLGPSPIVTDDLKEIDLGKAVGSKHDAFETPTNVLQQVAPGGESAQAFQARIWRAMSQIVQDNPGRTVVVVSHGGGLGVFLAQAAGEGPHAWKSYLMDNCALTEVDAQNDCYQMRHFNVLPVSSTRPPSFLVELMDRERATLVGRMAAELRCTGGKEYNVPLDQLEVRLTRTYEAFYRSIAEDNPRPLTTFIEKIVRQRTLEGLSHHGIQLVADAMRSVLLEAVDEACYNSPQQWLGCTRKIEDLVHLSRTAITDVYAITRDEIAATRHTELQAAYQQVKQRADEMGTFSNINLTISSTLEMEEVLRQIIENARHLLQAEMTSIYILDKLTHEYIQRGTIRGEYRREKVPPPRSDGHTSQIMRTGQPLLIPDTWQDSSVSEATLKFGIRATIGSSIQVEGENIGVFYAHCLAPRPFTDHDVLLMEALAHQAAVAIKNAWLFTSLRNRTLQLQAAAGVSRAASSILDLGELLPHVVERIRDDFDLYYVGVFLLGDSGQSTLVGGQATNKSEEQTGRSGVWAVLRAGSGEAGRKMLETGHKLEVGGASMIGWCVANARARIALDVGKDAVHFDNPLLPATRSELALPLVSRGRVIGAMTVQSAQKAAFSDEDITTLQSMTDQVAVAIENARLFAEERCRREQLRLINKVGRQISSIMETEELLGRIAPLIRAAFNYYTVAISLIEGDQVVVCASVGGRDGQAAALCGLRLERGQQGIIGWVAHSGQPIIVPDVSVEPRYYAAPELADSRSMIAMPLKTRDEIIGVLSIEESRLNAFDEDMLALSQVLADQVAIAIGNARLYEATQQAEREARQANQMKSRFLATMSHELRTPLNAIINFTTFVTRGMFGPISAEQASYLERVIGQGKHLLAIINDVLDLSKIAAGQMELQPMAISPAAVCREALDAVAGLAQDKQLALDNQVADDLPAVWADHLRLRQIVLNLLSNAVKFTPSGGHITVRAEGMSLPPASALAATHVAHAPCLLISVADTGIGIPADQLEIIFEEFHQTEVGRREGGTGLGLTISQRIVAMHGGHLWVESQVGRGSTFYFTLPLAEPRDSAEGETA